MNLKHNIFFFLMITLFIFSSKNSLAQYPGMGAVRAGMNAQFMNQQMQMMTMRNWGNATAEYEFQITMLDTTKKSVISAIYTDTILNKSYILLVDKRFKKSDANRYKRIYPSQTLYIAQLLPRDGDNWDENSSTKYYFGRPTDSCWMFQAKTGAINVFTYLPNMLVEGFHISDVVGIQLNDGPILKFTKDNLKQMIAMDANAMKYFDAKNYYKAIEIFDKNMEKAAKK